MMTTVQGRCGLLYDRGVFYSEGRLCGLLEEILRDKSPII
jgi:hypothetical protein